MCGRYTLFEDGDREITGYVNEARSVYPGANIKTGEIFPTNTALIMTGRALSPTPAVWGFPAYTGKGVIINARSETALDKKTFRDSLIERRCVIPTTGFYEWSREKQKYMFGLNGESVLYLAGIYKIFEGAPRFVVLTTSANEPMSSFHDRMPVILHGDNLSSWVNATESAVAYLRSEMPPLVSTIA